MEELLWAEFSGYTRQSKIAIFGLVAYVAGKSVFEIVERNNLEDSIEATYIYMKWGYIFMSIFVGACVSWITDNYIPRHTWIELCGYVMMLGVVCVPIYITKLVPRNMRHLSFYTAWFTSSFYLGSSGILHAVLLDQVNMKDLPDNRGYLRRYILYYLMCRTVSFVSINLMYKGSWSYDIKHYCVCSYVFMALLAFQMIFFSKFAAIYGSPLREFMLRDCLYSLVKSKGKILWKKRKGVVEYSTFKLFQILLPLMWAILSVLSCDLAERSLAKQMNALGEDTFYAIAIRNVFLFIVFPINEFLVIPFIMKHTFLKSSIHLFGVGFLWLSISLFIGGVFQLNFETSTTTQPSQRWFGQLRFFSLVNRNVILSIDEMSIKIMPHGAGSFLRIPVDINQESAVQVQVEGQLPYKETVEVQEMKSLSHYVGYNGIKRLRRPDPLNKLVNLEVNQSYYYALENKNKFVLKFISSDGRYKAQRNYPNPDENLEPITPAVYNVTLSYEKISMDEIFVNNYEFLPAHIYCLHSYEKNNTDIGIEFFLITHFHYMSHIMFILVLISSSIGRGFLLVTYYHFLQTESPMYLRGTTFTVAELLLRVTNLTWRNDLVNWRITSVGLFSMSFGCLGFCFLTWKYVLHFHFSQYQYK